MLIIGNRNILNIPMTLKTIELINIILCAIVGGMYWGPWLALTRSIKHFEPTVFLTIVNRLNTNMAPLMTVLTPLSLLTTIPVLIIAYIEKQTTTFYFTFVGFAFFITALIVTVSIEVPIVKQIITWTDTSLPENWEQLRDKWGKFHIVRVLAGVLGLVFLVAGVLF